MNLEQTHRSHARWEEGTVAFSMDGSQITTDNHHSEESAKAVCKLLEKEGYGGDNKLFPIETWVTPIPFEEQYPEEAEILADLCAERAEKKAKGKRLKPMFMDSDNPFNEPVTVDAKVGRNDPCPCGSGKKHKKCCL